MQALRSSRETTLLATRKGLPLQVEIPPQEQGSRFLDHSCWIGSHRIRGVARSFSTWQKSFQHSH